MNTEELHIFAAVYKCRSFSQAADKLYMSPQGISKVIVRLENEMGVQLFNRTTQGITPTLYADRLYSQAQDIHLIFERIKSIEKISSLHKETLNIFSRMVFCRESGWIFSWHFRYNIVNYTREGLYPNIALETSENTWIVDFALSRRGIGLILDDQVKLPIFQKYVEGKPIVFREIMDPEFKRDVYFLEVRDAGLRPAEKAFKKYLLDYLSSRKMQP